MWMTAYIWETRAKGRQTYAFVPDVRKEKDIEQGNTKLNYTTHFLSGHGNLKAKMKSFNLVESHRCVYCGELETLQHVLMVCWLHEEEIIEIKEYLEVKLGAAKFSKK